MMDGTLAIERERPTRSRPPETDVTSESSAAGVSVIEVKFKCEKFLPCDPRRRLHRYIVLFGLICMLMFGRYYCYYTPNTLESVIIKIMDLSRTKYKDLYLVYTWPNVVIPAIGGHLLDRYFGIRIGTFIFCALICLGQLLLALGGFLNHFWIMIVGRFIFGLGGENLAAATYSYMALWFKINEINMAFGFFLCFARVASTLNQNFSQKLYDALQGISSNHVRLGTVLVIGFGICFISLLCAIILGLFDRRAGKILKKESDGEVVKIVRKLKRKIAIKDILKFPFKLWLLIVICVIYYMTVDPFLDVAPKFFMNKYGLSFSGANFLSGLSYFISAIFCPVFGIFIGKTGYNLMWLNFGIFLTFCAHLILAVFYHNSFLPYLAMSLMGIAYSISANVIWPLIALIVPEYRLGTAFGVMLAAQNLGLAVFIIVVDVIKEKYGYVYLEFTFLIVLYFTLLAGVTLYLYDLHLGGKCRLNMSGERRARLNKNDEDSNQEATGSEQQFNSVVQLGRRAPYSSPLVPKSNFRIRNRLLSRMGTRIPEHISELEHSEV